MCVRHMDVRRRMRLSQTQQNTAMPCWHTEHKLVAAPFRHGIYTLFIYSGLVIHNKLSAQGPPPSLSSRSAPASIRCWKARANDTLACVRTAHNCPIHCARMCRCRGNRTIEATTTAKTHDTITRINSFRIYGGNRVLITLNCANTHTYTHTERAPTSSIGPRHYNGASKTNDTEQRATKLFGSHGRMQYVLQ